MRRSHFTRSQRMTIVNGVLLLVIVIVSLQLWLLTTTMNSFLGGDLTTVWPAAAASILCLGLNLGLLRYLSRLE